MMEKNILNLDQECKISGGLPSETSTESVELYNESVREIIPVKPMLSETLPQIQLMDYGGPPIARIKTLNKEVGDILVDNFSKKTDDNL